MAYTETVDVLCVGVMRLLADGADGPVAIGERGLDLVLRVEIEDGAEDPREVLGRASEAEIEAWRTGEVWGWVLDLANETAESCWGFYGTHDLAVSEGRKAMAHAAARLAAGEPI